MTTTDNPFVFYENQQVDDDGYLLFEHHDETAEKVLGLGQSGSKRRSLPKASLFKSYNNLQFGTSKNSLNDPPEGNNGRNGSRNSFLGTGGKSGLRPTVMLPWLQKPSDLEKRTLKIEVTFRGELILLRIIHIDKLFPVQYPIIALRIANNLIQNNLLREKNVKIDGPEAQRNLNDTTYIRINREIKIGKKLTKASSVATYETN